MDFLALVDELDRLIASSPRMPLTRLALVKEQDVVALLAQLRAALPEEAREAQRLRDERERIVADARADADMIIARANEEVERIIHDPHLLRDARARADEVLREAETKAEMVRDGADAFLAATLETFERHLTDLQTVMERDIINLRHGSQTLRERVAADLTGGELPLAPEGKIAPSTGVRVEYHEPPELSAPNPEPDAGPNTPAPDSPLA
jgi:vacuolar-type H+-ATPase subunit H